MQMNNVSFETFQSYSFMKKSNVFSVCYPCLGSRQSY